MNLTKFLNDTLNHEAFLVGRAGCGKTTKVAEIVTDLTKLGVNYLVTAHTHKACGVLKSKLPKDASVSTLHSFLKLAPLLNKGALTVGSVKVSSQMGKPDTPTFLIIDEFSQVRGEDIATLNTMQDNANYFLECADCKHLMPYSEDTERCYKCSSDELYGCNPLTDKDLKGCGCGECETILKNPSMPLKILYVGDPSQGKPIGSEGVEPYGNYITTLTVDYRTDKDSKLNKLSNSLADIVDNNGTVDYTLDIEPWFNGKDIVGVADISEAFKGSKATSKLALAFTNKRVSKLNRDIQGYKLPKKGDYIRVSNLKGVETLLVLEDVHPHLTPKEIGNDFAKGVSQFVPNTLITPRGSIDSNTKYNPIKALTETKGLCFIKTDKGNIASYFSFDKYNSKGKILASRLVSANKSSGKGSVASKTAYKSLMTYDLTVNCDFIHAMTVNKLQGSEYEEIYVATDDIMSCRDVDNMNRLISVGTSRASKMVVYERITDE